MKVFFWFHSLCAFSDEECMDVDTVAFLGEVVATTQPKHYLLLPEEKLKRVCRHAGTSLGHMLTIANKH